MKLLSHVVMQSHNAIKVGWLTLCHKGIGGQKHTEEAEEPPGQVSGKLPPVDMRGALCESCGCHCCHLHHQEYRK